MRTANVRRCGLLVGLMTIGPIAIAQPAPAGDTIELKGKVVEYSLTAQGAVNGLILADGAEIRIPPDAATRLAFSVRPGDAVTIRGSFGKAANPAMTVATVTNDATGQVVEATPPAAPAKIDVEGRIRMQLHDAAGRLNGVLLDDGRIVRMPPADAEQHAAALAVGLPLTVSGDGISTPLGKVVAARAFGPDKTRLTRIDDNRFERWILQQESVSATGAAAGEAGPSQAVRDRIEAALARHGIKIAIGGEGGAGAVSLTVAGRSDRKAAGEANAAGADTEIAVQRNAPLVIKSSGPVTIDIGAVILNSND